VSEMRGFFTAQNDRRRARHDRYGFFHIFGGPDFNSTPGAQEEMWDTFGHPDDQWEAPNSPESRLSIIGRGVTPPWPPAPAKTTPTPKFTKPTRYVK
jgi:hypothetical protein